MELLGWLWFGLTTLFSVLWSIAWFLLGGWVVTLVQLIIIVGAIFAYKYGLARAPVEFAQRGSRVGRFVWAWVRAREVPAAAPPRPARTSQLAVRRPRSIGDVNVSTLLSLLALAGLGLVAAM